MALHLDSIIDYMTQGDTGITGRRVVTEDQFETRFFQPEVVHNLAKKLALREKDLPHLWQLCDKNKTGQIALEAKSLMKTRAPGPTAQDSTLVVTEETVRQN